MLGKLQNEVLEFVVLCYGVWGQPVNKLTDKLRGGKWREGNKQGDV